LGRMVTNEERCTREIKSRIFMAKAAFDKRKAPFTGKLDLNFKGEISKGLHLWSTTLYGAETWTLRKSRSEILGKSLKCGAGERWRRAVGSIV